MGAQLARDVPFSAICWSTLEPVRIYSSNSFLHVYWDLCIHVDDYVCSLFVQMRRKLLGLVGDEADVLSILGANFSAGFVAGSLAAGATCPLYVAKTRRQIEVCLFRMKLMLLFGLQRFTLALISAQIFSQYLRVLLMKF
jgi:solute carrier family 25 protein 39/40